MPYVPPSPKLVRGNSPSKGQTTSNRLSALIPTTTTIESPVEIYQPGLGTNYVFGEGVGSGVTSLANMVGAWTAPDLNGDGSEYELLVECFGGGGAGGSGAATLGGGGGAGAEYALEENYTVNPGQTYIWLAGQGGSPGSASANMAGSNKGGSGTTSIFDVAGISPTNGGAGVQAFGGSGGDLGTTGIGGFGGTGSTNSFTADGGAGGPNASGVACDNPLLLEQVNSGSYWTPSNANGHVPRWLVLNDAPGSTYVNDGVNPGVSTTVSSVTNFTGGLSLGTSVTAAPAQVPAFTGAAGTYGPNATVLDGVAQFTIGALNLPSARIDTTSFAFAGTDVTISGWIQCDPSGTWGNTASGSRATIAANTQNFNLSSMKGYALYLFQNGTPSAPSWQLIFATGNGSSRTTCTYNIGQAPGNWYYVVATFASGTMKLYVNDVLQVTSTASFSSLPGGGFVTTLGTDPGKSDSWYFGFMSNFWFCNGNAAQASLMTAAFGVSPATGGGGGGASGDAGGAGGAGSVPVATVGGAGGNPQALPVPLVSLTSSGTSGTPGSNAGSSNVTAVAFYGAGGGAAGDKASPPNLFTTSINIASAGSYCGTDATGGNASSIYSAANQGPLTQLFQGGQASDPGSGTKNAVMLFPPGLAATYSASKVTIVAATLTVTNALSSNNQNTILELGYSSDTAIAGTWDGTNWEGYTGYILLPPGASQVTYDLMPTPLMTSGLLQNGTATALTLGPAANPTFDAYDAPAASTFYGSIYGPGSYDAGGNYLGPVLTLTYALTSGATPNQGGYGGPGFIKGSFVSNASIPVAAAEPFQVQDGPDGTTGNTFAAGFTGDITSFDPTVTGPGNFIPETWKEIGAGGQPSFQNGWTNAGAGQMPLQFQRLPTRYCHLQGVLNGNSASGSLVLTLPVGYRPTGDVDFPISTHTTVSGSPVWLRVNTDGTCVINNYANIASVVIVGINAMIPLNAST